jgi:hypothetical protein
MGLGFQVDIINDTGQTITVQSGQTGGLNTGFIPQTTLPQGASLNSVNGHYQYFELSGDTGIVSVNTTLGVGNPTGPFFQLEFDSTRLTNFDGIAFFGSKGDLATTLTLPNGSKVYPTLFLGVTGEWTLATLVLLTGASTF